MLWCAWCWIGIFTDKQRILDTFHDKMPTGKVYTKHALLLISLFKKRRANLPCIATQNKEDKMHGMYRRVVPEGWAL